MPKRVLIAYCIDVDACANWLNTKSGSHANASDVSRGVFGANVGTDRLLKFFDQQGIKATWFMPSHSILSFPTQMAKVRDAGHEIGLHGYTHEYVSHLTEAQERKVMAKSIEVYKEFTGKHPRGWAAPAWEVSPRSMSILEEFGLEYDHSMMHHDCQPYYVADMGDTVIHTDYSKDPDEWMVPMKEQIPTKIVELPASWFIDDWPPMQFSHRNPGTHGFVNPEDVERQWRDQFSFFYREYDTFIFPISGHPQVSGRSNVLLMQERFIEWLKTHEGVEFMTLEQICDEYKSGKIAGASVTAGV